MDAKGTWPHRNLVAPFSTQEGIRIMTIGEENLHSICLKDSEETRQQEKVLQGLYSLNITIQ